MAKESNHCGQRINPGTSMSLKRYAALKGRVCDLYGERRDDRSPHFYLSLDCGQREWRLAINVKSRKWPSEVAFVRLAPFTHALTRRLEALPQGLSPLQRRRDRRQRGLDYLRDDFFRLEALQALPHHRPGRNNDLIDMLYKDGHRALQQGWEAVAFGEPYNDRARRGLHNIHMNQGSSGRYKSVNGPHQDGALFLRSPDAGWIGYFWAFQSQAVQTDPQTGHALENAPLVWHVLHPEA